MNASEMTYAQAQNVLASAGKVDPKINQALDAVYRQLNLMQMLANGYATIKMLDKQEGVDEIFHIACRAVDSLEQHRDILRLATVQLLIEQAFQRLGKPGKLTAFALTTQDNSQN